jgi:catechol 2,3-dioxygenase-like lactoylglutathione lyase family enzyme
VAWIFGNHSVLSIAVIAIPVSDQARAREFYLRLGFDLLADEKMKEGMRWIQMGLPGSATTITLVTWFKNMPPGSMQGLVLVSDDLISDLSSYKSQGLAVSELIETPNGRYFNIKDPDGNGISIQEHKK